MMHSLHDLDGFELGATDGVIGQLQQVYFDDRHWVVRHLVVDTGGWLTGRQVLVSPHAVRQVDRAHRHIDVALTRGQIEQSPPVDCDQPVSRQQEIAAYDFHGYPYYWSGSDLWGLSELPMAGGLAPDQGVPPQAGPPPDARDDGDPHLRSSREVTGYAIAASDGHIGHVADFLIDPSSWQIRLLVVDTHDWLPDRLVLIPPHLATSVDWASRQVSLRISRQSVHDSPPYRRDQAMGRAQQLAAQAHFERSV